jgi:dethiobiotin synthetase
MAKLRFLISGTDTGVGKTTIGCALAWALNARGMRVGVMKPVETGCELRDGAMHPLDAIALRAAASSEAPLDLICPYRYRSPLAPAAAAEADGVEPVEMSKIRSAYEQLAAGSDVMLVEGAGGITVPITWRENYADLAIELGLDLILVVANRLGCLNAALLSLDYAATRGLAVRGYILNDTEAETSPASRTNAHSLARLTTVPCLGTMGYRQPMPREICDRLLL